MLGVGAAVTALLIAVAPRYGWHRDELYFLEAGKHLAWGYVDQPPFTPAVARLAHELAPGNLVVLRLFPALASAVTVLMGALIVRELGGTRRAQIGGAVAVATTGFVLGVGHLLATATFDLMAWITLLWLVARLLRTANPRLWAAFGGVAGLALLNKNLVVLLVMALGVGLVVERRWDLLRTPWLLAGGLLALAIASPNLLWQAEHDWPQVEMAQALSERLAAESRATLLPLQVLFAPGLVLLLWRGARWLYADASARSLRALLWAWPAGLAVVFATGGRPYYALPLTVLITLAGVVTTDRTPSQSLRPHLAINGFFSLVFAVPLLPLSTTSFTAELNEAVAETVGWPELVAQVDEVVDDLPAAEQRDVVLLAATYGEAGAIDRFGPALGLPAAYSPHNSYADFREPSDPNATVVSIRYPLDLLTPHFEDCEQVDTVDNGVGIDNEVQGTPIVMCRGLRTTWPETWDRLHRLS